MLISHISSIGCVLPLLISLSKATPYVGFPLNEQLPDVARVGSYFSFTLSNITYESYVGAITYSASNLPTWLTFDSSSVTFSGTPQSSDVSNDITITLTGADSTGQISNDYTLLVSDEDGPELSSTDSIFDQLTAFGETNGIDGLVVAPGHSFSISFSESTFKMPSNSSGSIVAYYGRSSDRTSLPNWIGFDSDSMTFSGTAPAINSNIAPSIQYSFGFIATDYAGFTGVESVFKIVVGAHQLSTSINSTIKINGTIDSSFSEQVPLQDIFIDGYQLTSANISNAYIQGNPSSVSFDNSDYTISGTFSNDTTAQSFQIVIYDIHGNDVIIPYELQTYGSVFTINQLDNVNATKGEYFEYQLLESYFTDFNDTSIAVNLNNSDWLSYHSSNLTLNGEVPDDFDDVVIDITASSSSFGDDSKSFYIMGVDAANHFSSSSSTASSATSSYASATSSASTATATATAPASSTTIAPVSNSKDKSSSNKKSLAIGLGVGIPIGIIAIASLLLCCFCCAKRRKENDHEKGGNISRPIQPENGTGALTYSPTKLYQVNSNEDGESPKQLSTLNVLKLDKKKDTDAVSTSSSTTHVDSFEDISGDTSGSYYDADNRSIITLENEISGQPRKSWRSNNLQTTQHVKRDSNGSLATVSTEQLFSVRLVENASPDLNRNSSFSTYSQVLSNTNSMILRDDSGNIQRLDSDGNIIGNTTNANIRRDSRTLSNLDILHEESPPLSQNSGMLPNLKDSPESNDLSFPQSSNSLVDEFKHHENSQGEIKWSKLSPNMKSENDNTDFYFQPSLSNSNDILNQKAHNLSSISVNSNPKNINSKNNSAAKLVEFSGKGSLRSSSHDYIDHQGVSAEVYHSDYD